MNTNSSNSNRNIFDFAIEHPISTVLIVKSAFSAVKYVAYAIAHIVETRGKDSYTLLNSPVPTSIEFRPDVNNNKDALDSTKIEGESEND